MSTKRILVIFIIGLLSIIAAISVMLLTSYLNTESDMVQLPNTPAASERPGGTAADELDRVEVNRDTIQAVVSSTLTRPGTYSRDVIIESFWEGGQAVFEISVSVADNLTSLRVQPPTGDEKRIVVTPDTLYIWYKDDMHPFVGGIGSGGDESRVADEWQMLVTYEDILILDKSDIIEAGYVEYEDVFCIYAVYRSPLLGNVRTYYISLDLGLVIAAEEVDKDGALIYSMKAGECAVGETDPSAFTLPDGTDLSA